MNLLLLHFVIALWVTALSAFLLGIFVYFRNRKNITNITFCLYSLSITWWSFCQIWLIACDKRLTALIWTRIEQVGVFFIPTFFVHFVISFLKIKNKGWLIRLGYLLSMFFAFLCPTRFMMADAIPKLYVKYFATPGFAYHFAILFFIIYIAYGLKELFKEYFNSHGSRRNQLQYLCWSSLIGYIGGGANFLLVYGINIPILNPFGTYALPLYVIVTAYAVIKYRLLEIEIAIQRIGIFLITQIFVFGIPTLMIFFGKSFLYSLFSEVWWLVPLMTFGLLAEASSFINAYLQHQSYKKRFQKIHETQESLEASGRGMIEIDSAQRLAKIIPRYLIMLYHAKLDIKIGHASIFLFDEKSKNFILESSSGNEKLIKGQKLPFDHPLNLWFTEKRKVFLDKRILKKQDVDVLRYEDIEYLMNNSKALDEDGSLHKILSHMKEEMDRLKSVICIPSFYKGEPMGFLLLGNKNQGTYNQEELDIFSRLATNAAAAFRSAQLANQIKQMQMGLVASGQLAAIGRLATSAKHEVNNPLQGIYGSIQRTLSYLKGTEDGYKLIRERIDTHKGRLDNAFSDLLKNEAVVGTEKISEIKEKLKLIDQAFATINERAVDDEKFAQNVGTNIKNIEDFQIQLKIYSESTTEEKVKDQFDEMVLLLDTIKHILDNIKKLNQTMLTIIERGKIDCERITEVIEIMYHLPRPDAKDKSDFTLEELLEKSFYFVRFQTYWENLSDTPIEKDIPVDLPKIRGFMGHLAIMFLNLITNAYQAMTDAGLTIKSQRFIKISANVLPDEPDFIEIRVLNKGPLIPEADLERIFEAGFTTKKKGSGMGLSLCKAIVEFFNNGSIYARNVPDFGPEFVIKLPRAKEVDKNDT